MDDLGLSTAPGAGERARRTDACQANRVHSFRCRNCSRNSLEVDPGHTLARLVRAQDSHSSDHGEGKGDRTCRLASSLTDRGRGYPTETRIRGGGRQWATSRRSRSPRKFPVSGRTHGCTKVAVAVKARRRHQCGEASKQLPRRQDLRAVPARTLFCALVEQVLGIKLVQPRVGGARLGARHFAPRRSPLAALNPGPQSATAPTAPAHGARGPPACTRRPARGGPTPVR